MRHVGVTHSFLTCDTICHRNPPKPNFSAVHPLRAPCAVRPFACQVSVVGGGNASVPFLYAAPMVTGLAVASARVAVCAADANVLIQVGIYDDGHKRSVFPTDVEWQSTIPLCHTGHSRGPLCQPLCATVPAMVQVTGTNLGLKNSATSPDPVVYIGDSLCVQPLLLNSTCVQCTALASAVGAYPVVGTCAYRCPRGTSYRDPCCTRPRVARACTLEAYGLRCVRRVRCAIRVAHVQRVTRQCRRIVLLSPPYRPLPSLPFPSP
jgi:hypothetical protein